MDLGSALPVVGKYGWEPHSIQPDPGVWIKKGDSERNVSLALHDLSDGNEPMSSFFSRMGPPHPEGVGVRHCDSGRQKN